MPNKQQQKTIINVRGNIFMSMLRDTSASKQNKNRTNLFHPQSSSQASDFFFFNRHKPFEEETANMIPAERINTQRRNEIVIPEKVFAPPKECSLFHMSWLLLWGKQKNLFEAEQWNQNTVPHRAPINSLGINTLPYHSITICMKHSSGHHLNPDCKRAWKSYRFS